MQGVGKQFLAAQAKPVKCCGDTSVFQTDMAGSIPVTGSRSLTARLIGRTLDFGSGRWRFESSAVSVICFKCLKELTPAFGDLEDEAKTPSRGLIFSASGNYGSRVYDPTMSAPQLVIWICDECVIRNYNLVKMRSYAFIQTETTWNDFDPERSYQ